MTALPRESPAPEDLLQMVYDRPGDAEAVAAAVLASDPSPFDASVAHHTIGLVQREFGDLTVAIAHLRTAVRLARAAGSPRRESECLSTLGIALVHAGRTAAGLRSLDEAVQLASGRLRARARFLRGATFQLLGRHQSALADLRVAIRGLRAAGDEVWTARALTYRGLVCLACGQIDRADRDFRAAEDIHLGSGQRHEYAVARWNRGLVAFRAGDLPTALGLLDDADRRCRELDVMPPDLVADRCHVLLAAGLPQEAMEIAVLAADELTHQRGMATRRTELLYVAASAALAAGDHTEARTRARTTVDAFDRQGRAWWREHAVLLEGQARFRVEGASARLLTNALDVAEKLRSLDSPDAVQADLLAGRSALELGRRDVARASLERASRARSTGSVASRITGWLARALLAEAEGRDEAMLAACRGGLSLLDDYQLTLGATELRARVTAQGAELATLALRATSRRGRPRQLLVWSERWRATTCAIPPVRPPDDRAGLADLVALREISTRIERARQRGESVALLDRERARLERQLRNRVLRTPATVHARRSGSGVDIPALLDELDDTVLVELIEVDGRLDALVCGGGRVRRLAAGRAGAAASAIGQAHWLLRSVAYGAPDRPFGPGSGPATRSGVGLPTARQARLDQLGSALERELLGDAVHALGDGSVVIVPPGRLHGTPWALLPSLRHRVHAVAPSARAWLTARTTPRPPDRTVLVSGPGLGAGGKEIDAVSRLHRDASVFTGADATAEAVIDALESSSLAHIAAHGEFRAESPLFSSLLMNDGPLTAYDLERLRRAPYRVVLPCCDSAQLQPVGADEILGLATALLPLGTAGLVAGVVPVNDAATVPVMVALHTALSEGSSMAEALLHARTSGPDDLLHRCTAWSFVAFGAA